MAQRDHAGGQQCPGQERLAGLTRPPARAAEAAQSALDVLVAALAAADLGQRPAVEGVPSGRIKTVAASERPSASVPFAYAARTGLCSPPLTNGPVTLDAATAG
jgi:hypothetical protein